MSLVHANSLSLDHSYWQMFYPCLTLASSANKTDKPPLNLDRRSICLLSFPPEMTRCISNQTLYFLPVRYVAPLLFTLLPLCRNIGVSLSVKVERRMMSNGSSLPWEMVVPQASCSKPGSATRHEVLKLLEADQKPGTDFLLVDVRREDHQVEAAPNAD